jgi:diguanylate cyclase (GGDEF)-like protein
MVSLCSRVALYLREKTKYSLVEIAAVVDERKGWTRIIASSRPEAVKPGFLDDRNKMLRQGGGGLVGQAVRTRSIVYAPDVSRSEQYVCLDERTLSEVDVPILFGERLFGVLCAESHRTGAFSEEDIKCLTILARHLGVLWAHLELLDQTMAKSLKDELTGLWNRRFLYEKLNEELDRTRRYKTGFSIVMIDLADFKDVNDKYGHPEGDRVLVEISDYLSRSMRESDSFFRYGGDEFIALLPEAGNAEVMTIMERIEKEMACKTWGEKKVSISADFGTASCPCDGTDAESLIRVADLRLYEAKRKRKFYKNGG